MAECWDSFGVRHCADLGGIRDMRTRKLLPRGFELELQNFDEEQRERVRREEFERDLSMKLLRSEQSLRLRRLII